MDQNRRLRESHCLPQRRWLRPIALIVAWCALLCGIPAAPVRAQPPSEEPADATPPTPPSVRPPSSLAASAALRRRLARTRMARSPEMFGDLATFGQFQLTQIDFESGQQWVFQGPLPGISASQKVADNGHPLPRDRVFYTFNHFQNAINQPRRFDDPFDLGEGSFAQTDSSSFFRHTIGIEKVFLDGDSSIEARLRFQHGADQSFGTAPLSFPGGFGGPTLDDLLLINKWLLYESEQWVIAGGMAVGVPTAEDVVVRMRGIRLDIENEAVLLHPFLASLYQANDDWFFQAYGQVQVAANGNPVRVTTESAAPRRGKFTPQTTLLVDLLAGRWLYQGANDFWITDLAAILEVHTLFALQDSDRVDTDLFIDGPFDDQVAVSGLSEDVLTNLTLGLHAVTGQQSSVRLGLVVPLDHNQFDFETIVQWNLFY